MAQKRPLEAELPVGELEVQVQTSVLMAEGIERGPLRVGGEVHQLVSIRD